MPVAFNATSVPIHTSTSPFSNTFSFLIASCFLLLTSVSRADLTILQYHHVSNETPDITSISPAMFERHLDLLEEEGMQVVSLPEAIERLKAGDPLPDRAVAITFDDAYDSIYREAFPRLKQRDWPFAVFVNTGAVDKELPDNMSWSQLREMSRAGATIANHTVSHPSLVQVPDGVTARVWYEQEISAAEKRLEEEVGKSYRMLAYPYGEYDPSLMTWLAEQGFTAFGQQSGAAYSGSNWQLVPRYPSAGAYAKLDTLKQKLYTQALREAKSESGTFVSPVLESGVYPQFSVTFDTNDLDPEQVQCFASGIGKLNTSTKIEKTGSAELVVNAPGEFFGRRARYNCTAPSLSKPGWFYWYSQLWINSRASIQ